MVKWFLWVTCIPPSNQPIYQLKVSPALTLSNHPFCAIHIQLTGQSMQGRSTIRIQFCKIYLANDMNIAIFLFLDSRRYLWDQIPLEMKSFITFSVHCIILHYRVHKVRANATFLKSQLLLTKFIASIGHVLETSTPF